MKKLLVTAAVVGLAGTVNAQSVFEGFYGQLATGYESNTASNLNSSWSYGNQSVGYNGSNQTFGGVPLILGLGYNFSVAPKWVIGVGADYSFINQKSSSYSSTYVEGAQFNGQTIELSNRFNVFVTPGYAIDKDKLLYFKAGYSSMSAKANGPNSYSLSNVQGISFPIASSSSSKTLSGYVLGLGYKQTISGGFYGFAEGNYMNYGKSTFSGSLTDSVSGITVPTSANVSLSSYQLLVGLGYRF